MMVNSEKERVSLLFMKALVSAGSMDAVSQQMASHPQYLESFLRTQHYILHMDGPLPLPYRHYIAIMVSEWAADSANLTSCTLYKSKGPLMLCLSQSFPPVHLSACGFFFPSQLSGCSTTSLLLPGVSSLNPVSEGGRWPSVVARFGGSAPSPSSPRPH